VRFSVVSGGLICIAGAGLMQLLLPALSRYQRPVALGDAMAVPPLEDGM